MQKMHMAILLVGLMAHISHTAEASEGAPSDDTGQAAQPASGTSGQAEASGEAAPVAQGEPPAAQPAPTQAPATAPAVTAAPASQPPLYTEPYGEDPTIRAQELRIAAYEERLQERERIRAERLKQREISRLSGRRFLISGGIMLGAGYLASTIIGGVMIDFDVEGAGYPFIPIVGNPIFVAKWLHRERQDDPEDEYDDDEPLFMASFMLLLPAIVQTVGAALLITGIVKRARFNKSKREGLIVTPTAMRNGGGLTLSMQF